MFLYLLYLYVVLAHETETNMKDLLPEVLSGVFSRCQFFYKDEDKKQENNN